MTVNVLAEQAVWLPGTLTRVDPVFASWLRRSCLGGATKLVLADLGQVPGRMRQAGFRGRDMPFTTPSRAPTPSGTGTGTRGTLMPT